jgi:hypothetical protein
VVLPFQPTILFPMEASYEFMEIGFSNDEWEAIIRMAGEVSSQSSSKFNGYRDDNFEDPYSETASPHMPEDFS